LDNQANVTVNGNCTLTGLTEGNHSIVVYANDTFGNMGKSETVAFTVAKPEPEPEPLPMTFAVGAILVSAVAIGAGPLLYFKKRKRKN
jgi:hypothetical protein